RDATRWRRLLRVNQLVRDVARFAGAAHAARQLAFALSNEAWDFRRDVLAILAAQVARTQYWLPTVAAVQRELDLLDQLLGALAPNGRCVGWRSTQNERGQREPLPVQAARTLPLDELAERFGLEVRRCGRTLLARCPFHDDRHPSLRLDLGKGLWHCFPCGIGGDGIALVMRLRGLSFAEAVREMAA